MSSIDHVTIRVSDLAASCDFYRQVFELLAFPGERHDAAGFHEWNDFSITHADAQHPPTHGLHIAFAADSREQIDAWWHALTHDDGRPGPRPQYGRDYYGAFIRDDDGNSVEAVRHTTTNRANGLIDHLWIRVADLQPVKRFYTTVAPTISLRPRDLGDRLQLAAEGAT